MCMHCDQAAPWDAAGMWFMSMLKPRILCKLQSASGAHVCVLLCSLALVILQHTVGIYAACMHTLAAKHACTVCYTLHQPGPHEAVTVIRLHCNPSSCWLHRLPAQTQIFSNIKRRVQAGWFPHKTRGSRDTWWSRHPPVLHLLAGAQGTYLLLPVVVAERQWVPRLGPFILDLAEGREALGYCGTPTCNVHLVVHGVVHKCALATFGCLHSSKPVL
jgi:hypothetical protein